VSTYSHVVPDPATVARSAKCQNLDTDPKDKAQLKRENPLSFAALVGVQFLLCSDPGTAARSAKCRDLITYKKTERGRTWKNVDTHWSLQLRWVSTFLHLPPLWWVSMFLHARSSLVGVHVPPLVGVHVPSTFPWEDEVAETLWWVSPVPQRRGLVPWPPAAISPFASLTMTSWFALILLRRLRAPLGHAICSDVTSGSRPRPNVSARSLWEQ
jgi:hypothetical protein